MSTADAVAREAAWLASSGDGLPALLTADGGPWDVVQAYSPRTPAQRQSQIYVLRRSFATARFSQQRRMPSYAFRLVCLWPVGGTTVGPPLAETEQAAFDVALDLLVQRIEGYVDDHSHGGRFMSVAEAPNGTRVDVAFTDAATTLAASAYLAAEVTYSADDGDYVM